MFVLCVCVCLFCVFVNVFDLCVSICVCMFVCVTCFLWDMCDLCLSVYV
jgi:hypothetical protein